MQHRILTLTLSLLLLHACAEPKDDFPREVFSDGYAAAIDQGFVEAVIISTATLVIQNREEPDLAARIQSNLPGSTCFSVNTPSAQSATLEFDNTCQISGRDWSGSIAYEVVSDSDFTLTYNASVEDRPASGVVRVSIATSNPDSPPGGTITTENVMIDGVVSTYETELDYLFGTVRANDDTQIEGYRISGSASWNNEAGNLWSSTMRETLVRPDSNVPHSGTRVFDVDGSVEFRMLIDAITADSTAIVLRAGSDTLRICVDENDSEACPSA